MWKTLVEMMAYQAAKSPDVPYVRFLESGQVVEAYTFAQTWEWANRWAALFQGHGLKRGDAVILALPNIADFVGAYYGILLAGGVPAPATPIRQLRAGDPYLEIIAHRLQFISARLLVLPAHQADAAQFSPLSTIDNLAVLTRCQVPDQADPITPQSLPQDLGLYQFTSGTSGDPKVVQLTQEALLAQARMISIALRLEPTDSAVSWLPLFHDMGLIGFLLTPAWVGGCVNLMLTEDFILRPGLWLKALSELKAPITGGPPSAYALVARRMKSDEVASYRLDHVRIALVGAEMVTQESLDIFASRFASIGFRRSSLMPTYGMAENGLAVSMPTLGQEPKFEPVDLLCLANKGRIQPPQSADTPSRAFASVGWPLSEIQFAIVNQAGQHLEERRVGEIIIQSPSLMKGYYHQPEATRQALRDGWLYTGDLGYLSDGQLYITGRRKEVIIVGGRNYYPEDLEEIAARVQGVRMGRVVAASHFDTERATEAVVILAETGLTDLAEREALRKRIRQGLVRVSFPVSQVILLRPKTIQSTPNGKVMRVDCCNRYLAGEFSNEN